MILNINMINEKTADFQTIESAESAQKLSGAAYVVSRLAYFPERPGVYRMLNKDGKVLYVGKAKSLRRRLENYAHPERTCRRIQRMISEIRRVLRPGGILYVNDFLLNTDERNKARYEKFKDKYGEYGVFELPEGAVCRHHDEKRIKELLGGFAELEYSRLTFTTMNGHRSNGFYFIGRAKG